MHILFCRNVLVHCGSSCQTRNEPESRIWRSMARWDAFYQHVLNACGHIHFKSIFRLICTGYVRFLKDLHAGSVSSLDKIEMPWNLSAGQPEHTAEAGADENRECIFIKACRRPAMAVATTCTHASRRKRRRTNIFVINKLRKTVLYGMINFGSKLFMPSSGSVCRFAFGAEAKRQTGFKRMLSGVFPRETTKIP